MIDFNEALETAITEGAQFTLKRVKHGRICPKCFKELTWRDHFLVCWDTERLIAILSFHHFISSYSCQVSYDLAEGAKIVMQYEPGSAAGEVEVT